MHTCGTFLFAKSELPIRAIGPEDFHRPVAITPGWTEHAILKDMKEEGLKTLAFSSGI